MTDTSASVDSRFRPAIATRIADGYQNKSALHIAPQDNFIFWHSGVDRKLESEFMKHEKKWKDDTRHISSPIDKYLHPSYARIIGLGWPAVKFVLRSLQKQPDDWFYALRAITNVNPVSDDAAGDVKRMSEMWIGWGKKNGVL